MSMAMSTRLMMRQGQSLVMTPQLLQAIKLLQFSNLELAAFLQEEIERNPLLESQDSDASSLNDSAEPSEAFDELPTPAALTASRASQETAGMETAGLSATSWTGVSLSLIHI